jgi:hypothetical protein
VTLSVWWNTLVGCASAAGAGMQPSNKMQRDEGEMNGWARPSLDFDGETGLAILVFVRIRGPLE